MASETTITLRDAMIDRIPPMPSGVRPDREVIADVAAFIAERFVPQRIVLFGSRAYGTPSGDSDIDLLVIMDVPERPVEQAIRIRQALDLRPPLALDILVRTPAQIQLGLAEGDFFIEDIMTQGVTLFEAGDTGLVGQG